ncbi:hypothetical protein SDC9_120250 [bioreactor metagenome]|uniref:Uncharacterized protein n=1 Tax=bioreactor metagenome TaxID=1076179 RepID=A0A645C9P1_9ZZZZ
MACQHKKLSQYSAFFHELLEDFGIDRLHFQQDVDEDIVFAQCPERMRAAPIQHDDVAFVEDDFLPADFLGAGAGIHIVQLQKLMMMQGHIRITVVLADMDVPFFEEHFLAQQKIAIQTELIPTQNQFVEDIRIRHIEPGFPLLFFDFGFFP